MQGLDDSIQIPAATPVRDSSIGVINPKPSVSPPQAIVKISDRPPVPKQSSNGMIAKNTPSSSTGDKRALKQIKRFQKPKMIKAGKMKVSTAAYQQAKQKKDVDTNLTQGETTSNLQKESKGFVSPPKILSPDEE